MKPEFVFCAGCAASHPEGQHIVVGQSVDGRGRPASTLPYALKQARRRVLNAARQKRWRERQKAKCVAAIA